MSRSQELTAWARRVGIQDLVDALVALHPEDAIFAVDGDRRVVFWSEGAERLLGFAADDVLGEHCLKSNRCASCMEGCGIARLGDIQGVALEMFGADDAKVPVLKDGHAFFDADGTFLGGVERLTLADAAELGGTVERVDDTRSFHGMVSGAPQMHAVFETIARVAATDVPVLVRGESGTGKELVAKALHDESPRAHGPFIAVNCAALTPTLLEAELFGHTRGAFTGAVRDRAGLFEQSHEGTLFLDEIAELPLEVQAKLLRVLESGSVVRVGADQPVHTDVRIVAATHRSLREEVAAGRFREDLMYRLRVVPLFLPPLRERPGDVPRLLRHFLAEHHRLGARRMRGFEPDAMRALLEHRWPGNVRELKNVVDYAFAVGPGPSIRRVDLPPEFQQAPRVEEGRPAVPVDADEATRIRAALDAANGHIGEAAELLGMSRPTFWRKRRKYGID